MVLIMNNQQLQQQISEQLSQNIQLHERANNMLMLSMPFKFPDGDQYSIYINELENGLIRISDCANTIMRLSYDTPDVEKYFNGNRGQLMDQILKEYKIIQEDGNFYIDVAIKEFAQGIFRLTHALSQIYDLSYLDRDRVRSTFYEDLERMLNDIIKDKAIEKYNDYKAPDLAHAENYIIDYALTKPNTAIEPLFLFGVPSIDKAKLVTITLHYFWRNKYKMRSLIIFENQEQIGNKHLIRLMDSNIGGSQVSSIELREPIQNNIERHFDAA